MLHPCLEATVDLLYHASYPEPYYAPGEESIEAMIQQLVLINSKIERRKVYNANGIIRLCDFMILKFSCWRRQAVSRTRTREKSAPITAEACSPPPLAMLKSVGNRFSRVSPETFQKLNLYFVQASDEHIRLWSAQYASNGIYKFALDDKVEAAEDRQQDQ
ncbi:hypothetical protein RMCBS344292_06475 [Rhizopus microsporus]|nr:hypothetical protein RMCBS344292_06475 [Rhizopus microsporus]